MATHRRLRRTFLERRRIAVVGVARDPKPPATFNDRELRDSGRTVFAVNPTATESDG